jgi:hypothetical protein
VTTRSGTVALFATPFAAVDTGAGADFNARVADLCEARRAAGGDSAPDPLHFRSRDDLLEAPGATAGELRQLVLRHACGVVAGLSTLSAEDFGKLQVRTRGWCSIVQRNGHVDAQHFPGASWLAVYCVRAGEPDAGASTAGVLRLYERRLGSIYRDAGNSHLIPPYRYGNHAWTPVPGWMALFPAHVPHEISVVRSASSLILVFAMIRYG